MPFSCRDTGPQGRGRGLSGPGISPMAGSGWIARCPFTRADSLAVTFDDRKTLVLADSLAVTFCPQPEVARRASPRGRLEELTSTGTAFHRREMVGKY